MRTRNTVIKNWSIRFFLGFRGGDKGRIFRALLWAEAPDSILRKVSALLDDGEPNVGFSYSDPKARKSVVGVSHTDTGPEFLDSVVHEIFHVAQDIGVADDLDLSGEDIAYLAGDISRSVSDIVCEMSCPHCHE